MIATMPASFPSLGVLLPGAASVFAAGVLRGFTGYGFAVAAVPLLSLIVRPTDAVPIVLVLQVFISANGLGDAVRTCDWRSIRVLGLAALATTPLGVIALTRLPDNIVRLCIAAIVALAVLVLGRGLDGRRFTIGPWAALFGGAAGLFNGLAAMPGPPVIAYYLASGLGSVSARASMIVLFLATSTVAIVPLTVSGTLTAASCAAALAAMPVVWAGSHLGARLFPLCSERTYRWTGLIALSATALVTATQAVLALA